MDLKLKFKITSYNVFWIYVRLKFLNLYKITFVASGWKPLRCSGSWWRARTDSLGSPWTAWFNLNLFYLFYFILFYFLLGDYAAKKSSKVAASTMWCIIRVWWKTSFIWKHQSNRDQQSRPGVHTIQTTGWLFL